MATVILDNIGSGNGLLPVDTKPLPDPLLTYHPRAIKQHIPQQSVTKSSLTITYSKIHSNLPGAGELSETARNYVHKLWIHWLPMNSPHKDQWRRPLMFSLIYAWINGWITVCHGTYCDSFVNHFIDSHIDVEKRHHIAYDILNYILV